MAQQYGTSEETQRTAFGSTGSEGFGTGMQGSGGHYGEPMPQSTQTGPPPLSSGQQLGGSGGQMSGSSGQQHSQMSLQATQAGHSGADMTLEDALNDEMRVTLHDFVESAKACEWCADRCIDEGPHMAECIRLCRDVADLATLNVQLMSRDSIFGLEAAELFASAAEACAQECAQHSHRHCQECAEVLSRAARSTEKMIASFGGARTGAQPSMPRL